jgi:hypothetical protein
MNPQLKNLVVPIEHDIIMMLEQGRDAQDISAWFAWQGLVWDHKTFLDVRAKVEKDLDIIL